MEPQVQKRYLTISEAAELLSIPAATLQRQVVPSSKNPLTINGQAVKINRINKRVRIDRQEIEKLMALN